MPEQDVAPVAVVVTTYQQRAYLADGLSSVRAQSRPAAEVVVVDDGSDEPVDDVVAQFPGVRLIRQDNQGASAARNTGVAATTAPYVVFLDADDRLLPDALAIGVTSLEAAPEASFTSGASRLITADGTVLLAIMLPQPRGGDLYLKLLRRPYICPPSAAMFRRSALEQHGGWLADDALWGVEDWEFFTRLAAAARPVCHGRLVAEYRMHGTQSSRQTGRMLRSSLTLMGRRREQAAGNAQVVRACRAGERFARAKFRYDDARAGLEKGRSPGSIAGALVASAVYLPYRVRGAARRRAQRFRPESS